MMFSFVIPTRNQAGFLSRCIDSCLAQGIVDSEIIVVDGASTDGTIRVLDSYGPRIRWISEPDKGQSDALNKGIKMAQGEFIAWINSDDYYPCPDVLKRVESAIEKNPKLDIIYGDGMMVDGEGKPFRRFYSYPVYSAKDILIRPVFVLQPALFFRRRIFFDAGGLRTDLHLSMDQDLWLRMFPLARSTLYIPEIFAHAVYHSSAKSVKDLYAQVNELWAVKDAHRKEIRLNLYERIRYRMGMSKMYAYVAAVKLGLWKHC
ncbi:glycosyltransferase [bacterium]|nr:glycosyltransferase [bacterium]